MASEKEKERIERQRMDKYRLMLDIKHQSTVKVISGKKEKKKKGHQITRPKQRQLLKGAYGNLTDPVFFPADPTLFQTMWQKQTNCALSSKSLGNLR